MEPDEHVADASRGSDEEIGEAEMKAAVKPKEWPRQKEGFYG